MPQLRFSLMSLLLFCVWSAALVGVYVRREPWVADTRIFSESDLEKELGNWLREYELGVKAPDGKRIARASNNGPEIVSLNENRVILKLNTSNPWLDPIRFVDDSTLILGWIMSNEKYFEVWHRRYPEWWWGHFYRVEVWLAVLIPLFAIARAVIARRGAVRPGGPTEISRG